MAAVEPYLGSVDLWPMNWAPRDWAICNGALLPIAQYSALFALLSTTFGGDGRTTFGIPDLRGRVPVGAGTGSGLPTINFGAVSGSPTNTLTMDQLPAHTHTLNANTSATGRNLQPSPTNNFPAQNQDASGNYAATADTTMNPQVVVAVGKNLPVNNMQPYLGLNYIISLQGVFPTRD
ncbi:MAG: tail fiber protein [Ignavibacteriaceae bacterium]|jgi:microcystin-dependent protein|nr:tail fiber protein [Ignavibacteriaceae bacterium]